MYRLVEHNGLFFKMSSKILNINCGRKHINVINRLKNVRKKIQEGSNDFFFNLFNFLATIQT